MKKNPQNIGKQAAAAEAALFIQNGMTVGLGTGSTAAFFIKALGERIKKGLSVQAVASSQASADLAKKHQIPLIDINSAPRIHITVDGADEIDPKKQMIKGGGGALLKEKILASSCDEMVVIVDETKLVDRLGTRKLPVEILYFGSPLTRKKIEDLGYRGEWRMAEERTFFITENGNLIFDIEFNAPLFSPEEDDQKIIQIPGVIETGFFFNLARRVLVGCSDGSIKIF